MVHLVLSYDGYGALPKTMYAVVCGGKSLFFMKEGLSVRSLYAGYAWWRGGGEDEGSVSV